MKFSCRDILSTLLSDRDYKDKSHGNAAHEQRSAPSHSFDPQIKERDTERPFSLFEAVMDGDYLLPEPTQMQTGLLNVRRVSEDFRRDYCEYMRSHYPDCGTVREAIEVGKKYTGNEDLCVENDWDLLGDMVYTKNVLGFSYWEYFTYGLREKTPAERIEFIPEKIRTRYFRKLNTNNSEWRVIVDKYQSYQRFKDYYKREIVKISGKEDETVFSEFCERHPRFIAKPLDELCGNGVRLVDTQSCAGISNLFLELLADYTTNGKRSFLCEELIVSHPVFASIHPESVNSLRMVTYYNGVEPKVIIAWLKSGRGNSVVDNGSAGGLLAAIDCKTGVVTTPARNEANETFEKHPDTGFSFAGFRIEGWDEAVRTVKEAALMLDGFRIVGWDVALSADKGWQIIEANGGGMVNLLQVATQQGIRRWFLKEIEWTRYKE